MHNLDTPQFAVPQPNKIPVNDYLAHMTPIPPSRMFLIRDALTKYKQEAGADAATYDGSQGDGGASLPGVPADLLRRAAELQIAKGTGYDQPWGTPEFRKALIEQYWKLDAASGWGVKNAAFVQGGRDGLIKAYQAMAALGNHRIGDALVVSRVPWISYNWGPYSVGLNVLLAPGRPEDGWAFTPESIRASADFARQQGRNVAGLVITSPDNPTGRTISIEEQIELAQAALAAEYPFVLFDWIYHWISENGPNNINTVLEAFTPEQRKRLMFLDGLTKSLGASNVRSAWLMADTSVIDYITSQSSHGVIPSYYAQAVAIAAFEMGFENAAKSIIEPTGQSRRVLRAALEKSDLPFIMGDGYYAFINCEKYVQAAGYENTEALLMHCGEKFGVVFVPGIYFSEAGANWIRFSYALPPEKTEKAIARLLEALQALV